VDSAGNQANGGSLVSAISADGRYVAFTSLASNLVTADSNECADIFVHDRVTGTTERVSVSSAGEQSNSHSGGCLAISADARYVVFVSQASNLVDGDTNDAHDIFVHDRATETTERVSVSSAGEQGNSTSVWDVSVSPDGRYVAFYSDASNLVPGDTNGYSDVFVRDRWGFSDIASDYWASAAISACAAAGIVSGYGDGLYHPDWTLSRDQMAVFISRSIATPTGPGSLDEYVPPTTPSFSDVATDYWAYEYIEYAAEHNIVGGYDDGTYHPDYALDRGQMAVFIARAMAGDDESVPDPTGDPSFPDVAADFWSYRHIEYIAGEGVAGGYYDGLYHPEIPVTRDQMAVYIAKAFGLLDI